METKRSYFCAAAIAATGLLLGGWLGKLVGFLGLGWLLKLALAACDQAETDSLTGLKNRRCLSRMESEYYPAVPTIGVIFLDLNQLKQTNDTRGHKDGDCRLTALASVLAAQPSCTAFRFGGDEFLLIAENIPQEALEGLMQDILSHPHIHAAAGYALGPGSALSRLIAEADAAMGQYKASESGSR